MKLRKRRPKSAVSRLNLSPIAQQVARNGTAVGIVTEYDGTHYRIQDDGDRRIFVHVTLLPEGNECEAELFGGPVWAIPDVGAEVIVALPDGSLNGRPTIVATMDVLAHPRTAPGRVVIWARDRIELIAPQVFLSSDGTSGEPLITKSQYDAHKHPSGTGPTGIPDNATTSGTEIARGQ